MGKPIFEICVGFDLLECKDIWSLGNTKQVLRVLRGLSSGLHTSNLAPGRTESSPDSCVQAT